MLAGAIATSALLTSQSAVAEQTHRVGERESLWWLARRYSVSVEALRAANGLVSDRLRVGQVIRVPARETPPTSAQTATPLALDELAPSPSLALSKETDRGAAPVVVPPRGSPPAWVFARPSVGPSLRPELRDKACTLPGAPADAAGHVREESTFGRLLLPKEKPLDGTGGFPLVIHFHGGEHFERRWLRIMRGAVLLTVDAGLDEKSYVEAFGDAGALARLVESVERRVAGRYATPSAFVKHLTLSAWGPGGEAVDALISAPEDRARVSALTLYDALHVARAGTTPSEAELSPYLDFARQAARGERFLFLSHSAMTSETLASPRETTRFLLWKLGMKPSAGTPRAADPAGLELESTFTRGSLHVRGFLGADTLDHCAQLALSRDVLRRYVRDAASSSGSPSTPPAASPEPASSVPVALAPPAR